MSSLEVPARRVRISRIAGRYLVFDIEDAMYIRRHHGICGVLVGTLPQNPTQNLFLGMPIEVYPEDVQLLLAQGVAYLADSPAAQLAQLKDMDADRRKAYVQSIQAQRRQAQSYVDQAKAAKMKEDHRRFQGSARSSASSALNAASKRSEETLFEPTRSSSGPKLVGLAGITPTTAKDIAVEVEEAGHVGKTDMYPFYAHLNSKGYFFTPGLRFGGDLSVYPGDPFRYHAHFLAKNYGWHEEISMLDIVTSGRLGTSVKKSFLLGGQKPPDDGSPEGMEEHDNLVRTFSIEWGGM
jgi:tRNA-splicing endonuclease subunit Sen34